MGYDPRDIEPLGLIADAAMKTELPFFWSDLSF